MKTAHCIVGLAALALAASPAIAQTALTSLSAQQQLASANNAFACDLYARLKDTGGNLFFSPFSVSSVLAMACAGARGDTAEQMRKVLRFPASSSQSESETHAGFAALLKHLDEVQRGGSVQIAIANSLWPQNNAEAPLLKSFLSLVKQNYGAEITPVDFVRAEPEARARINRWVEEKTRDKIKNLVANPLARDTRLVLVNAVYFKGTWECVFEPKLTKEEPFYSWNKQNVKVPLMRQTSYYRYGKQIGVQFIELPYAGGNISMFVILPSSKTSAGLAQMEKKLSSKQIQQWRDKMEMQEVRLFLPKFKIDWGAVSLVEPLKSMGMSDTFVRGKADFSGMNDGKDLYVGDIFQKAFVDVSEEGTEAAAATITQMVTLGGPSKPPPPPPVFRADHPFLFFIQDNATGSILFMGRVVNPAAQ